MPRIQVGSVSDTWQFGIELGYLHRALIDFQPITRGSEDRVASQLYLAAMVTTVSPDGPRGEMTFRASVPIAGGAPGLEGLLGFRWTLGPVELVAAAGPGFGGQTTTPALRGYFGAAFANVEATRGPSRP